MHFHLCLTRYIFSAKICCHDEISRTWVTLTGPPPTTTPPPPPPTGASRTWSPASWIRSELRASVVKTAQLRTLLLKENSGSFPRYRHPYIWLTKLFYYVIRCTLRIFVDILDFHGSLVLHKLQARRPGPAAKEADGVSPVQWSRGGGESRRSSGWGQWPSAVRILQTRLETFLRNLRH